MSSIIADCYYEFCSSRNTYLAVMGAIKEDEVRIILASIKPCQDKSHEHSSVGIMSATIALRGDMDETDEIMRQAYKSAGLVCSSKGYPNVKY